MSIESAPALAPKGTAKGKPSGSYVWLADFPFFLVIFQCTESSADVSLSSAAIKLLQDVANLFLLFQIAQRPAALAYFRCDMLFCDGENCPSVPRFRLDFDKAIEQILGLASALVAMRPFLSSAKSVWRFYLVSTGDAVLESPVELFWRKSHGFTSCETNSISARRRTHANAS